jgi:hypothetical protein
VGTAHARLQLLGGPVPHKSVLRVIGYLAALELSAEMTVEARDGFREWWWCAAPLPLSG